LASHRQSLAHSALPIGTLIVAMAVRFGGLSAQQMGMPIRFLVLVAVLALIFATVFVVLHHAEVVALRIGEPYGTLLLTFAVTVIEASVIVSLMLHEGGNPTLAREAVFSTVMIVCTGVVGICLTFGGLKHHYQDIKRQGTNASLAVIMALSVLTLLLPNFTLAGGPGSFSQAQLAFVSVLSVLLYGSFVAAQMVGLREDFIEELAAASEDGEPAHRNERMTPHVVLLFAGLAGIVLMAEEVADRIEDALEVLEVAQADAIVGFFVALLVLTPEAASAIRAALNNQLQRGLNVALGSVCATIGLTFPVVGATTLITGRELTLGLAPGDVVLLVLALAISVLSFGTGRTTILTGLVHLVVFVAYLLLIFVP
jgi:Ca2+:H+ antiporter